MTTQSKQSRQNKSGLTITASPLHQTKQAKGGLVLSVRKPRPTSPVNHNSETNSTDTQEKPDNFIRFGWGVIWFAGLYFGAHVILAVFR
jgi:hypothetical protein